MARETIGVIGLGLMGDALAGRLIASGYAVLGHDIASSRREALEAGGGEVARDPTHVASRCDRILLSLPTTDVVEDVLARMDAALDAGHTIVDTTTGDPRQAAVLGARLADRGVAYLDATLSGSSAQARTGDLIVTAGGTREAFTACEDLFRSFARRWFHVGAWGDGDRVKLVSNLVLGLNRAALAEALAFARRAGLDDETVLAILKASAAYSRVMDTKGRKMIAGDFTPQAKLSQHLKDVRLILEEGSRVGAQLPLSALHRRLLEGLEAIGLGHLDNSAIIRAFEGPVEGA